MDTRSVVFVPDCLTLASLLFGCKYDRDNHWLVVSKKLVMLRNTSPCIIRVMLLHRQTNVIYGMIIPFYSIAGPIG